VLAVVVEDDVALDDLLVGADDLDGHFAISSAESFDSKLGWSLSNKTLGFES
jgi:hypothetical protein